jgi:hypothetical protein
LLPIACISRLRPLYRLAGNARNRALELPTFQAGLYRRKAVFCNSLLLTTRFRKPADCDIAVARYAIDR